MKFLADENFNNDILRGVWRRIPSFVFIRVQDTEIAGADDDRVLDYAAKYTYIVLTHDVNTMRGHFYRRMQAGDPLPGLFLVHKHSPVAKVIDALELILSASDETEWLGHATYVPFD
ncbi:MAG: DUF5615 family PIN-like protein [Anaerolineae bacterium]|nr:MAG: hypothetical protein UZ13_01383 [Chloroflexi bacterium OLB13]MBW7880605.1 DUF5615 family PIN-like protein [Anaerolineae bacterium]